MSFWSLEGAPKWWFSKQAWLVIAVAVPLLLLDRWYYGPDRIPPGRVVFYGATTCGYSQALQDYLVLSKIPFERRNVDESFEHLHRYTWASGRGAARLPLVQVGGRVVSKGFYQDRIDPALRSAGYEPAKVRVADGYTER